MRERIEETVARARGGDAEARRELVESSNLRIARVALGDNAQARYDALRELERGDGPAPLGILLAAIALDDDGELRRALELVRRNTRRWGPPERAAVAATVAQHGARLNPELAIDVLEWAVGFPEDIGDYVRGLAPALASAHADQFERFGWSRGFQAFVMRDRDLVLKWSAQLATAKIVARALFHAQSHGDSAVAALERIWENAPKRETWATALAEAVRSNYGMSHRDEIVAWSWRRFCSHEAERREVYTAFEAWRDLWIELRNTTPAHVRPGGKSAVEHLKLWGGLAVEHLSAVVEEVKRLARDDEWAELVDITFDLGIAAPLEFRRHGLAGACRIASEVANRIRAGDTNIDDAGDRVIARGEALARELRETGAVIDEIVANRAEDLDTEVRLIREARERVAEGARRQAEYAERERQRAIAAAQAEADRAEAQRAAEEARIAMQARLVASLPRVTPQPIDDEIFFASLPAPTLNAYARLFKRLSSGGDIVQSLVSEGVSLEMIAVINQTWGSLFAQRPELAMRFSVLISSQLS
jgi:hypothetical protein